jgi:Secretion system C-terminal sorting domain
LSYTFCLPDGCYEVDLETEFPISAEYIMIQAFLNGIEIPDGLLEMIQGDEAGTLAVGLNSDCFDSVDEMSSLDWELFPNPSDNILNVSMSRIENAQLNIYDMTGKLLIKTNMSLYGKQVDISSLPSGVYSAVLTTSNALSSKVLQVVK